MRRAPDSDACHRAYLEHLLSEAGGARGWRSSTSVLIAAPQGHGWLVDDFAVDTKEGATDGRDLWNAFAAHCAEEDVRLVCPAYEAQRAKLAAAAGLVVNETWWLRELEALGCAAVEVNQAAGRANDSMVLSDAGFRRHCDFYTGRVREI
jgi:hypothetical protein